MPKKKEEAETLEDVVKEEEVVEEVVEEPKELELTGATLYKVHLSEAARLYLGVPVQTDYFFGNYEEAVDRLHLITEMKEGDSANPCSVYIGRGAASKISLLNKD